MTTKNGQLNDGREVYLNGNYVSNLASEAVFSRTLKIIQRYYDLQHENKDHTFFEGDIQSSVMFLTPKSPADLAKKRQIYGVTGLDHVLDELLHRRIFKTPGHG